MSSQTVAKYLVEKLRKQQGTVSEAILRGDLEHVEYKRLCGTLTGFEYCIELIQHTEKQLANDEELEDE